MGRTLIEMKLARGGLCNTCGKDIMDPSEQDHTFCNDCWDKAMAHPFELYIDMEGIAQCDLCDEPKEHRIHIKKEG